MRTQARCPDAWRRERASSSPSHRACCRIASHEVRLKRVISSQIRRLISAMFTRFASVDDFLNTVMSEQRHYSQLKDEALRQPVTEYQLWLDDSSPDKKPFEVEFRKFLEIGA